MIIRTATPDDAPAIAEIYNHYVLNTAISFETEPVSVSAMRKRIEDIRSSGFTEPPYFVCEIDGIIVGYSYAHAWKERRAYYRSLETTVYVAPDWQRHGIGFALMRRLIDCLRSLGHVHSLIACITDGNKGSCRLHERLGFRQVSHFKEVGYKFGRYIDVVDYEMILLKSYRPCGADASDDKAGSH